MMQIPKAEKSISDALKEEYLVQDLLLDLETRRGTAFPLSYMQMVQLHWSLYYGDIDCVRKTKMEELICWKGTPWPLMNFVEGGLEAAHAPLKVTRL